ncbi:MAG: S-layer homology domain-containing protein [Vallitaleaceae bacterium]|jgi:hypothetical protein|nr:S-layer homology domain-containing protein [Vallitaleaceae bacterium]
MKHTKHFFVMLLVIIMAMSSLSVLANQDTSEDNESNHFSDVPSTHYAYNYIKLMSELGIIDGYGDGTFGPYDSVSKSEFAKMMVLTLGLSLNNPSTPTFKDVVKADWEYTYVETAKYYMTFWNTAYGYYFKPDEDAAREDMAVAIVKGLGIDVQSTDMSVLDNYTDADLISPKLRSYVAAAINEGIMIGNGSGQFNPQSDVIRGDAATLLARMIEGEKVTFDEEKMTFENGEAPVLSLEELTDYVKLEWTPGNVDNLSGYKVVISEDNSSPSYPDQGYITYTNNLSYSLRAGQDWHNGETNKVVAGTTYYVAITALYNDGSTITGNVEIVTIPGSSQSHDEDVTMTYAIDNGKVDLQWTEVEGEINYYKVVMSEDEANPMYPTDGYAAVLYGNSYTVEVGDYYNGGDLSSVQAGKTYYVAITVVYKDGTKVSSNVARITMPGVAEVENPVINHTAPTLSATTRSNDVLLNWTAVAGEINYYKVVLSKSDATPSYPDNGYVTYQNTTSYELEVGKSYSGGDVGSITSGQSYYVAITVVYKDGTKLTSNVKRITMP